MVREIFNFEKVLKNLDFNQKIFQPNLTTKLSIETALEKIKNNDSVLDLGCGCGIIGITLLKNLSEIKMHCSDIHSIAIKSAKNNYVKNDLSADIRNGNLFEPWSEKKFDYILSDVSSISSSVAKISPWFGENVPCESGEDGTDLACLILKNSPNYLKNDSSLQIPLISLSNTDKIINYANNIFSEVKTIKSMSWFLPKEMDKFKDTLYDLKSKKFINFEEKFEKIICTTSIVVCKDPK
tara:strand:- start:475 stop:1191 length:717 start_codon:yes stop_codon:yes gene_type:complete